LESGRLQLEAEHYNQERLADDLFIVTPKMFHYYINHSCDSNVLDVSMSPNSIQYVSARPIGAGEEITADYYNESTLELCNCRSPRCRWINRATQHPTRF
jgi:SET domain-containing protein